MTFDPNFTTSLKSHQTRQLNAYIIQLLIGRKCISFWLDLSDLFHWTPWMLKSKYSGCEFKYFGVKERTLSMQEGRPEVFTNFSKWPSISFTKYFLAHPINFSFLFKAYLQQYSRVVLTVIFKFQITKEVNIHNNIQKNNIQINYPKNLFFCHIKILLQQ